MNIAFYVGAFLISALLSLTLTWCVRHVTMLFGIVAAPSAHHIHKGPIPRLGGVAIFLAFVVTTGIVLVLSAASNIDSGISSHAVLSILVPGALIFALGLYDDVRPLKSSVKLAVQAVAAVVLFSGGVGVFSIFGLQYPVLLALPLTILWVLWITNAFNLIDGIDGLAAGSALFSTVTVFVISLISDNSSLSLLTMILTGAILGFLRFNFNPATIFLGDCGSLFIGFMLSALALTGSQKTSIGIAVAIPVVAFGLPILETAISVVRRFLSAQPLFVGDREHIHHKLLEQGFSQRQVVVVLYVVSAICGLLSLLLLNPGRGTGGVVLFLFGAGVCIGVRRLGYHEFLEIARVASRTIEQRQVIKNDLTIRRAVERLSKANTYAELFSVLREAFVSNDFDGFHLTLDRRGKGWTRSLFWRKPAGAEAVGPALPQWSLELRLISIDRQNLGRLSLWRASNRGALLVDVNVITGNFQKALCLAVVRARSSEVSLKPIAATAAFQRTSSAKG